MHTSQKVKPENFSNQTVYPKDRSVQLPSFYLIFHMYNSCLVENFGRKGEVC